MCRLPVIAIVFFEPGTSNTGSTSVASHPCTFRLAAQHKMNSLRKAFAADRHRNSPHLCTFLYLSTMHINYEFKARHDNLATAEATLKTLAPLYIGEDHQVDTYFNVPNGRLKLREGVIEHALIFYQRSNVAGAKQSDVTLYQHQPDPSLKQLLAQSLGIKTVVDKKRSIYFIDNVKFHFDEVKDLGTFVEVEAIDKDGSIGLQKLKEQCSHYQQLLGVPPENFVAGSYSDLLLAKKSSFVS